MAALTTRATRRRATTTTTNSFSSSLSRAFSASSGEGGDDDGGEGEGNERLLRSLATLGGAYAPFSDWLRARAPVAHPSLVATRVPGMGVGLAVASDPRAAPVKAGDVVLRLPRDVWHPVSADAAVAAARSKVPAFAAHVEDVAARFGARELATHALFALHLLFELGDDSSSARPYLATLPSLLGGARGEPSVPALWSPEQIATLRGTPTHAAVLKRAKFIAATHAALFPVNPENGQGPAVSLERYAWATATVLSRATRGEGTPYTLMPCADLLNHGAGARANCVLGASRAAAQGFGRGRGEDGTSTGAWEEVVVTCSRDVARGEQLLISYGDDACNDKLLRLYGFAVADNPNDRREIVMELEGDALERWNATELLGPGLSYARTAVLRMRGLPRLDPFADHAIEMEQIEAMMRQVAEDAKRKRGKGKGKGKWVGEDASAAGKPPAAPPAFRDPDASDKRSDDDAEDPSRPERSMDDISDAFDVDFDDDDDDEDEDDYATTKETTTTKPPPRWRCFVAHPKRRVEDASSNEKMEVRSIHWSPYDRVRVVDADP
jgi:hypothetical protein